MKIIFSRKTLTPRSRPEDVEGSHIVIWCNPFLMLSGMFEAEWVQSKLTNDLVARTASAPGQGLLHRGLGQHQTIYINFISSWRFYVSLLSSWDIELNFCQVSFIYDFIIFSKLSIIGQKLRSISGVGFLTENTYIKLFFFEEFNYI